MSNLIDESQAYIRLPTDYFDTCDIGQPFIHAFSAYSGQLTIGDDIYRRKQIRNDDKIQILHQFAFNEYVETTSGCECSSLMSIMHCVS